MQAVREKGRDRIEPSRKKFLKNFKKGIDKGKEMWYNSQAVRESGSEMVIENWTTKREVQSINKQSECEVKISSKSDIYSTK